MFQKSLFGTTCEPNVTVVHHDTDVSIYKRVKDFNNTSWS